MAPSYVCDLGRPSRGPSLTGGHFEHIVERIEKVPALVTACKPSRPAGFKGTFFLMVVSLSFIPPPTPPPTLTTPFSTVAADPALSHEEHVQDLPIGQRVSLNGGHRPLGQSVSLEETCPSSWPLLCEAG